MTFIVAMVFVLGSCNVVSKVKTFTNSRTEMLNSATDEEVADEKLKKIIDYINNKDEEGLESLFSKRALDKSDDFSKNADLLFDFLGGKVTSWEWEENSGPRVSESTENGNTVKEVHSYYQVKVNKETYFFSITDFQVDDTDAENEGIYMLLVVKEEDNEKIFEDENEMVFDKDGNRIDRNGIYLPILEK